MKKPNHEPRSPLKPALLTLVAAALGLALCVIPGRAGATCIETCGFYLLFDDCRTPVLGGTWPAELPLSFGVKCGGCCSPPGGPMSCNFTEIPDVDAMNIVPYDVASNQEGSAVKGEFKEKNETCSDFPVFQFTGKLEPGMYVLTAGDRVSLNIVDTGGHPESVERMPLEELLAPPEVGPPAQADASSQAGAPDTAADEAPGASPGEPPKTREGGCASCSLSLERRGAPLPAPAIFILSALGLAMVGFMKRRKHDGYR